MLGATSLLAAPTLALTIEPLGTYSTGSFDEGAAEISTYDPASQRLFVVNGATDQIDILDLSDPTTPTLISGIDITAYGGGVNSVAFRDGLLAAAIEAENTQDPGSVVFFDANGKFRTSVTVGALPDMLTFTPDGTKVLVANEGEPSDDYTNDPEGSVSIITVADFSVVTAPFTDIPLDDSVRVFGPGASAAQDFEPEYIAVSADSTTAWVSIQENNALGILDLSSGSFERVVSLGFKDYSDPDNSIDASDSDGLVNITTHENVFGMYQPDAIATYTVDGETYIVTANEGDARDYEGFSEEERVAGVTLDPTAFPNATALQAETALGRLQITTTLGDTDTDGDYDQLYAYGGRSFSILDAEGNLVFDSGNDLEQITANQFPEFFNVDSTDNEFDGRSDAKGPEPEGVVIGAIDNTPYAFIGLERISGFVVYDLSNPQAPTFITYINNRDFSGNPELGTAGDLGPEGLLFIPADDSPTDTALLVVTNEVSGTTTVYSVEP